MIEAHFENIRNLIKGNIKEAQSDIKIAVAWFTQRELFAEVLEALNRGVEVSMIIIKDFINFGMYGLPLQRFVDNGGKLHFVSDRSWTMHNKFCLFDGSLVITGSYNWTYSAETRNAENVILTDDHSVCQDYNDYFTRLWDGSQKESQVPLIEISSEDVIKDFSMIHDEIDAMAKNEIIPTTQALEVLEDAKSNVTAKIATVEKPIMPSLTPVYFEGKPLKPGESVLLKTMALRLANGNLGIVERGARLPFSKGNIIVVNEEGDTSEEFIIETWSESTWNSLTLLRFEDLPPMPDGRIKFKAYLSISKNGLLSFSAFCEYNRQTKETEGQLVEGKDFIIGK